MAARTWKSHAAKILGIAAILVLLGWLSGYPEPVLIAALGTYAGWNAINSWRLNSWLRNPSREGLESFGIWSEIFSRISALQVGNTEQQQQYRSMIDDFQHLTDAFPDATLVIDEQDNITWCNDTAGELLDLRIPDDFGQPITNLLRGPDFADWLAVQEEVASKLEMPSPQDESTWLSISAVALRDGQRLVILRDHSEVHNLEQIRRDFVANISHELRTPLTVLLGYLEMLAQEPPEELLDTVSRMRSQAQQMQSLLNDLLELSRLQSDDLEGEEEEVDVPAILMQLKEQAEELSGERHTLVFDIDPSLRLRGTAGDFESAARNLIVNAVNYTPEDGRIIVRWEIDQQEAVLTVEDTGMGIPKRSIPRLTERFYRVGSDRARSTGGTGLGLAIVKHVLNAHQARLDIQSELGEGSVFRCHFPAERIIRPAGATVTASTA